jgi:hypothetical protein
MYKYKFKNRNTQWALLKEQNTIMEPYLMGYSANFHIIIHKTSRIQQWSQEVNC